MGEAPQFLKFALREVTEAAARAACQWIGRGAQGDARKINQAAVTAMRNAFASIPIKGQIAIGDGSDATDQRAAFANGEIVGDANAELAYDIAVDPVEGTSFLMRGMTNAMAVLALAPKDTMLRTGPAFYMEKFVGPPAVRGKIDPLAPLEDKLAIIAHETGKNISDLIIYVLEKPRHRHLIENIQHCGARVAQYPAGDIAGAIMAARSDSGIDAMIGTGGTPEGIISACAIRALGGEFLTRYDPQLPSEHIAVREAGISTEDWMSIDHLVSSNNVYFVATGITTGLLFDGIERLPDYERTESLLISGETGEYSTLTSYHKLTGVESGIESGAELWP